MDREKMKEMMGINTKRESAFWKLNKVQMSGDTGEFTLTNLLAEREEGEKPKKEELGKELSGVILKMRWMLSRYDEPNNTFYSSTEYDDKWKDEVTVYPPKDKGSVEQMKGTHGLQTQRVIYFYLPNKKEVVRLYVKASGLTGDKNPNKELGLFEYINSFEATQELPCEYITICKGVAREGKNADGSKNKRKDHVAMSFSMGRKLTESEQEKITALVSEVHEKTKSKLVENKDDYAVQDEAIDEALKKDEINPDDIPF